MQRLSLKPKAVQEEKRKEVFLHWLEFAVRNARGLLGTEDAKTYVRIYSAIDSALSEKKPADEIELEDVDYEWLKDTFVRAKFPPENARVALSFWELFDL